MIKLYAIKTEKEHFEKISLQSEQLDEIFICNVNDGMFSIVGDDGNIYGIFEAKQFWKDRICIKAFVSKDCGGVMLQMVRLLKRLYKQNAPVRLEAEVLNSFINGKKFLKLFDFKQESLMKQYYNGKDYCLFVKFKNG